MSPDAVTADRVYREVKRQIMLGELRPGEMLILSQLAESAGTSVSPVRDAILRMVGERIVDMQGGGGFAIPSLTQDRIAHFYNWHGDLMRIVFRAIDRPIEIGEFPAHERAVVGREHHYVANLADELFATVAASSQNAEHLHAVLALEARLHVIRIHEIVLPRCLSELESLWNLVRSSNKHSIRTALWHYHRRRLLNVETIFSAMMKNGFII